MFPSILLVDDEPSILQTLGGLLSDEGFEVTTALNGYEALKIIDAESPDLVLLDIWMPGIDGIETLMEIKKTNPHIQVIIITGHGTIETAVKATKIGAFDLIEKPLSIDKVIVAINNALNFRKLEEENQYLRKKTLEKHSISGNSPPVAALKKQIFTSAPTDLCILLLGENGAGKELVARTIHHLSARAEKPMITVNCAMIPDELIESELFGREKGAVPGATTKTRGKFELANEGTLFLDEIGDMSLKTQGKMLRALETKEFQRVGGSRILTVDVRVIAATNKNLETEIENGSFREDLYYRINVVPMEVPPLRRRIDDLPLLVETFLDDFAKQTGYERKTITKDAVETLRRYSWPGNVRELKNLIERMTIMAPGPEIDVDDIPEPFNPGGDECEPSATSSLFQLNDLNEAKKAFEKEFIRQKYAEYGSDALKTAEGIGVDPDYLDEMLG
ncbi:MAG: sigma-54-dependent Fis family transcriptional regulator [Desulfobacterales bacterium]|nr:sigma-54-dependent Fis family transcriptional regulator [Desulfobacterales bacterium]